MAAAGIEPGTEGIAVRRLNQLPWERSFAAGFARALPPVFFGVHIFGPFFALFSQFFRSFFASFWRAFFATFFLALFAAGTQNVLDKCKKNGACTADIQVGTAKK